MHNAGPRQYLYLVCLVKGVRLPLSESYDPFTLRHIALQIVL